MRCRVWVLLAAVLATVPALAQENRPPVASVGHGAFIDATGRQIVPTEKFISGAIAWYRNDVMGRVPADRRLTNEKLLGEARRSRVLNVNQRLFLEMRAAEWLYANAQRLPADDRNRRALNAFGHVLRFELPKTSTDLYGAYARRFDLGADFESYLQRFGFGATATVKPLSATTNAGMAYINECRSHGVPIPPPIGDPRWVSRGPIPKNQLFIRNESVEVQTFSTSAPFSMTNPEGLCIALPRSNDTNPADGITVALDGVICLGKRPSPLSGKSTVCFWDNQMNGRSFDFNKGDRIPIGEPDLAVNPAGLFMSGGAQLTSIGAGMCSDCHAGQNPFVVHPNTVLGQLGSAPLNLPMFGDTWYDPLVLASWPQNEKRLNDVYVPAACRGCHTGGGAGRLPHLSTELNTGPSNYCITVLQNAVGLGAANPTMPPSSPGSAASAADVKVLVGPPGTMPQPFCELAPTAGPANRGDPHIVSTNGVAFDFQAAGEFVALTDGDGSFELQTRQSPVQTSFVPGPNPYTGLASCVALNTAVALRMGKQRVTYQPVGQGDKGARMQLRIDGKARFLERGQKLDLGQGNFITENGAGSLTFGLADGTRVIATPRFWESQGYWYIDIEVLGTTARAGIMGHIGGGEWLPRGGDGTNFGPRPVALADRAIALHAKFANSWRVTDKSSLFDYDSGQSTKSFTDPGWALSASCRKSTLPAPLVREPASPEVARLACAEIQDKVAREQCSFDVRVMNDAGVAKAYLRTLKLRATVEAAGK